MSLTNEQIYREMEGTLLPGDDPSGFGSQATEYGYLAGNGTSLRKKHELFTALQDESSSRPISVQIRDSSKVGPGVVEGQVFVQALKQSIDPDEDYYMEALAENPDTLATPTIEDQIKWQLAKELYMTGLSGDGAFQYTDEFQAQFVDAIPNNLMPNTRLAMIESVQRAGSRNEEMSGLQITLERLIEVERWRDVTLPGTESLYG